MNQLAHDLAANYEFVSLEDFADRAKAAACPELDTSFMAYFLELANEKNDGQFVVPHEKLTEYGVATSEASFATKKRLAKLGLLEGQDYRINHKVEPVKQGSFATKNQLQVPKNSKKLRIPTGVQFPSGRDKSECSEYRKEKNQFINHAFSRVAPRFPFSPLRSSFSMFLAALTSRFQKLALQRLMIHTVVSVVTHRRIIFIAVRVAVVIVVYFVASASSPVTR